MPRCPDAQMSRCCPDAAQLHTQANMTLSLCIIAASCLILSLNALQHLSWGGSTRILAGRQRGVLCMGRAAVVRAATKARTDGAKAKNNGRFAKKIFMAVKAGGPDPVVNRMLGHIIEDAKAANVPKDIIVRNIEKASAAATADYKESVFEFYGYGGVGLLVNVLTDNDNRATADVNLVAKKNSLKSASTNSVAFKFTKKARIDVSSVINEDQLLDLCLDVGVDDYELRSEPNGCPLNPTEEGKSVVYVDLKDMAAMRDVLRGKGLTVQTKLAYVPLDGFISLSEEDLELNMLAMAAFEALDDVDSVEHNIDMTEEP
ncbi:YebC/PmpR family DNA-binding transcriptional regulator [archaeon]|nr:MAG: YebC/PmpR family DNA-binding transcriptional regulator [archaeon]